MPYPHPLPPPSPPDQYFLKGDSNVWSKLRITVLGSYNCYVLQGLKKKKKRSMKIHLPKLAFVLLPKLSKFSVRCLLYQE